MNSFNFLGKKCLLWSIGMVDGNERKFLHDIASPLGTAIFLLDMTLEDMAKRPGIDPMELDQVKQAYQSLKQTQTMLEARREVLIKLGVPSTKT